MNSEERDVINTIFQRIEQASSQQRDPEAERFIADKIRAQPYAPYAMAQLIYVQEEAIKSLNQQLEQARAQQPQGSSGQPGGFFASIFGSSRPQQPQQQARPSGAWGQPQQAPQGYAPQQGGPWGAAPAGYAPQAQAAPSSGFLGSALKTAAGVAGGLVVGNALMNAFSGHNHANLGSFSSSDISALGGSALDNPGGQNAGLEGGTFGSSDPGAGYQDAGFNSGDFNNGDFASDPGAGFQDASYDSGSDFGSDLGSSSSDDWT